MARKRKKKYTQAKSMSEMLSLPSFTSMFTVTAKPRPKKVQYEVTYTLMTGPILWPVKSKRRHVFPRKFDTKMEAQNYVRSLSPGDLDALGQRGGAIRNPRVRRVK